MIAWRVKWSSWQQNALFSSNFCIYCTCNVLYALHLQLHDSTQHKKSNIFKSISTPSIKSILYERIFGVPLMFFLSFSPFRDALITLSFCSQILSQDNLQVFYFIKNSGQIKTCFGESCLSNYLFVRVFLNKREYRDLCQEILLGSSIFLHALIIKLMQNARWQFVIDLGTYHSVTFLWTIFCILFTKEKIYRLEERVNKINKYKQIQTNQNSHLKISAKTYIGLRHFKAT